MAKLEIALALTLKHEGGYTDNPNDIKGGETYRGISRLNNPRWVGWAIIDANKPLKQGAIIKDDALDRAVAAIYKVDYWNKIWGENIANQDVANFLFDWFVNSGYHSISAIQQIIGERTDGVMGTKTIRAINNYPYGDLVKRLIEARIIFVKGIVNRTPKQAVFLDGWLSRINSYA